MKILAFCNLSLIERIDRAHHLLNETLLSMQSIQGCCDVFLDALILLAPPTACRLTCAKKVTWERKVLLLQRHDV